MLLDFNSRSAAKHYDGWWIERAKTATLEM